MLLRTILILILINFFSNSKSRIELKKRIYFHFIEILLQKATLLFICIWCVKDIHYEYFFRTVETRLYIIISYKKIIKHFENTDVNEIIIMK